jgi:hypothetical protein
MGFSSGTVPAADGDGKIGLITIPDGLQRHPGVYKSNTQEETMPVIMNQLTNAADDKQLDQLRRMVLCELFEVEKNGLVDRREYTPVQGEFRMGKTMT